MEQLTFNEIIDKITDKLSDSDEETITSIYNQLFDTPITYVGDDMWEEEYQEEDEFMDKDTYDDEDEDEDHGSRKTKKSKYNDYDPDEPDYNDDDE